MRHPLLLLPFVLLATAAHADDDTSPEKLPVATVDVIRIYKTHKPFQERLQPLRSEVQEIEKTVQLRQVEIEQVQRQLAKAQGDERGKLQVQLAKLQTELRVFVEQERQEVQRNELRIQAECYKKVQVEVEKIAKERAIKLVIVRPQLSLDSQDPNEIGRALNQIIIYEEGIDITDDVLKALDAKSAESAPEEPAKEEAK